ncbi:PREDICTED: DNA-binding protein RFX2 isoform X1 [Rhagoletis zephyria]|uniref:DNA-binding protein RFX2 isoform X1 n=1 Tax=Rhagoletis zephyria TaxID=28612 RepID=UPI0008115860|nr:PREDICTED: DNA-binding protein RFX2 isoform X1 [Rhagoletis zephyria]
MTTRLASQRNFVISTAAVVSPTSADAATTTPASVDNADGANSATANVLATHDIKHEEISIETANACSSSSHGEQFEYVDSAVDVVPTTNMDDVMIEHKKLVAHDQNEAVALISVVVPMDASNSASSEAHGDLPDLSAIKDNVELAQQVANGQVTLVQTQSADDDEGTPQFITVTVSAQDAGQNYQVQYVDTELYHGNSSQTQMTYPFCPVGDYQANGQAYYSTAATSNYATASVANTPTTHASSLPYLVPVEEGLLLNTSSQSHSRDSPHSLTEVAYIQETQSTPQTPTSTTTTNSVSGGSIGTGGGGASPDSDQNGLGTTNKVASATIKWLSRNYETADGVSLPRSTLYNHYIQHCNENKLEPVNAASFGKLIRSVFSGLRTRRLGTRGNSKYHYYGIRIKPDSILNHMMDEKPTYSTHSVNGVAGSIGHSTTGGVVTSSGAGGSCGSGNMSNNGNRSLKKLNFKPETYETCAQYLGDGAGAIPTFPPIELDHTYSNELSQDDVETFRAMYREHCESFLDAVLNLEFSTIEFLWREFWRATDNNNMDECEEEKYLSKAKLYLLCHCAEVQKFIKEVDYQFYQNMVDVIIPDVLRSIPNALTQAIRNFAKNLELWLCESMVGVPDRLVQIKSSAVSAFCQTLRRYTSLNHLAQAARAVLQNGSQITQMLNDLNRVDFHNVQEQAAWVCQCEPAVVQRLENDFKAALQQQSSLEQWASWLQLVVDSALQEYRGKPSYAKAARQFLLKWSFYSSMVIRDLTLRSASSFGSFHLIRLLYDEYMFYLVEHKIAEAQQKTTIAVICDRMHKDIDFEFDYQLEFISESHEQQQQQQLSSSNINNASSSVGNSAKRLKHE